MPSQRPLRVCLTGGGTAGHVTPHFALLPLLKDRGFDVFYVGSSGIESELVRDQGVRFHQIPTGKLRRYFSLQNFFDIFKVGCGIIAAFFILMKSRPAVVFSKGGFVSVPVAVAAWMLRIPVVSHESDLTPGLATKIAARFARQILFTFPETGKYLPSGAVNVGTPIRPELFQGSAKRGRDLCGFLDEDVATLLVMGGSQGATRINEALATSLPSLVKKYRVVHLTGRGKQLAFDHPRYRGFEYVNEELKDLLALADIVVSRAGANSIFELLALRKPMLLIPLVVGSRGDQVLNAQSFEQKGWARMIDETTLNASDFEDAIDRMFVDRANMSEQQMTFAGADSAGQILTILERFARGGT